METTDLVVEFDATKNVVWRIAADSGSSSPIIAGDRLFYSSHRDDQRSLHCIDRSTGKQQWSKHVNKRHDEIATAPNDPATPTPVTDGELVCVFFPDYGVVTYTVQGEFVWDRHYTASNSMHGLGSSLIIADNKLIHLVDQLKDSYIVAYEIDSGDVAWKVSRVSGVTGGYSTPIIYRPKDGAAQLIATGPMDLAGYELASGKRVWWVTGITNAPISTPLLHGETVFCSEPIGEPLTFALVAGFDKDKDGKLTTAEVSDEEAVRRLIRRIDEGWGNGDGAVNEAEFNASFGSFEGRGGLVSVNPSGQGDVTQTHVNWSQRKSVPHIPSVAISNGTLFFVSDGGVVTSVNADTGEVGKRSRLGKATGKYFASPVATNGKVYLASAKGVISVLDARQTPWKVLATNSIGEAIYATPAISEDRLFVRTEKSIYCFGTQ